ncbi:dipeptide ABC transporter ATP-binding protein [Achromobacter aloeverae]|uniref:ABC transporter ATP-binding protein n=1 Tax=Achromobacter aloeverae TaxID=1750518 RepID=A0A4Q1HS08_9BURK|nr:ABC transporter ATP-binding protein [Achromobacter aloeverae]RXN93146.1 ABC transporter ATP-binding protein [Achromobacter aloeverae]
MKTVLKIEDYCLEYATPQGPFHALNHINLDIGAGEVLGLVGESGSGKTSIAWSIMRYLPRNATVTEGAILLGGDDLLRMSPAELDLIRGRRISMVFQDPSSSLNPTLTLGEQLLEVMMRHRRHTRGEATEEAIAMLERVGLKDPAGMMARYPHEASGGEKQRVMIATAFACRPECIIFDEPTTALDVITGRQILDLFTELQAETGVTSVYISHDLALVSRIADRVAVIHKGTIVEQGDIGHVFARPAHAYTQGLLNAVPRPDRRLVARRQHSGDVALLRTRALGVNYGRESAFARLLGRKQKAVVGNQAISVALRSGEILGVVGESGSGKSTLAKALTGLNPFHGELYFQDDPIAGAKAMGTAYRRDVQIIFQHPDASLNPRQRIKEIVSRPLRLYGSAHGKDIDTAVRDLLEEVRLPRDHADRYPHQLSGGEKQRVAIARAFASHPKLVICDEITSALDVSVQASVIELLVEFQKRFGTAYIFITHDLNLVRQIAHRIAVMYCGELVDLFDVEDVDAPERHPYTRTLIDAVPVLLGGRMRAAVPECRP